MRGVTRRRSAERRAAVRPVNDSILAIRTHAAGEGAPALEAVTNGYIMCVGVDPPPILALGHAGLEASPLRGQNIFELFGTLKNAKSLRLWNRSRWGDRDRGSGTLYPCIPWVESDFDTSTVLYVRALCAFP